MDCRLNVISKTSKSGTQHERFISTIFRRIKHNRPRGAPFHKTAAKTQIYQEPRTGIFLEAVSAVINEDSEELDRKIKNLNDRIRTDVHIRHNNSHIIFLSINFFIFFFTRNLLFSSPRIKTFPSKNLRIKTHSLRIETLYQDHRLQSLLQILNTCLLHNKFKLPVMKVVILCT